MRKDADTASADGNSKSVLHQREFWLLAFYFWLRGKRRTAPCFEWNRGDDLDWWHDDVVIFVVSDIVMGIAVHNQLSSTCSDRSGVVYLFKKKIQ